MPSDSLTTATISTNGLDSTRSLAAASESSNQLLPSSKRQARLKKIIVITLFLIGLTVCVMSLVCILMLPTFVTNQISKRLVLSNNSMLLERWSKPNVPMLFKVWIFDVTNANDVLQKRGTKPKLQEIGPFVFNLRRQKDIVSFAGDNLYYTERKIYHFNERLSCCAINTTVTVPNIPLVAVVDRALSYQLPLLGRFIPRLINRAIQSLREQLFIKRQVREILFEGYDVELLKMVSRVGSLVGLPQSNQRFAILKGRNDTWRAEQDGVWAINTGERDRKLFGRVSSWNSYRKLPFWASDGCNTINGSDGTLFPPPIKADEPLYIFNQELCRTINLVYAGKSDVRSIEAYRFVLNPMNFAHTMQSGSMERARAGETGSALPAALTGSAGERPVRPVTALVAERLNKRRRLDSSSSSSSSSSSTSLAPEAAPPTQQAERLVRAAQKVDESQQNPLTCFCDRKTTNLNGANVCEFDGLIDLSKCTKQAQVIFGSMPHFHQSDQRLLQQVTGLKPNASKHTTYMDIEPNTGLVLGGKRRVQLNLIIKQNNEVEGFENIKDMLVPIIWFEESAMIPEESALKFKSMYTERIRLMNLILFTLFFASIGLIAIDLRLMLTHYSLGPIERLLFAPFSRRRRESNNDDNFEGSDKNISKAEVTRDMAKQQNSRGAYARRFAQGTTGKSQPTSGLNLTSTQAPSMSSLDESSSYTTARQLGLSTTTLDLPLLASSSADGSEPEVDLAPGEPNASAGRKEPRKGGNLVHIGVKYGDEDLEESDNGYHGKKQGANYKSQTSGEFVSKLRIGEHQTGSEPRTKAPKG